MFVHSEPMPVVDEQRLIALGTALSKDVARFMILLGEFDVLRGWQRSGALSCVAWLQMRFGMSPVTAREQLRVARALRSLPIMTAAFAAGDLSYSKVRALTRIASGHDESDLVGLGLTKSGAELDDIVRRRRREMADADPAIRHRRRGVFATFDDDGMMVLVARLEPDRGLGALRTIDAVAETISTDDSAEASVDNDDLGSTNASARRRADALCAMLELRAPVGEAGRGREKPLVVVHVDADVFQGSGRGGRLENGIPIAPETLERLGCDATTLTAIDHACGVSHNIGRSRRRIPDGMRRRLRARDRWCRFPGCSNQFADAHHVRPWSAGGETALHNLTLLCRRHHRLVHEGGFRMTGPVPAVTFFTPDGEPVTPIPAAR